MNQALLGPGQIFAQRYRIERFLAEGGFGAVYVAEQLATEAHVAVKVLWPHILQARDAVERFQQEARIAGRVNSEHIVRVLDAGFDDMTQMPFLVMELLEGEDLGKTVERGGPLAPELVVEYLRQTASALDRAHAYIDRDGNPRPIVHRDLKPENLFVSRRDRGGYTVKVLDFGIAKILSSTTNVSQEVKGTPLFMAFEQAAGGTITPRADIWALGLIAFYLLTGQSYWRTASLPDASLMQLFAEVLSLPLAQPSARLAELGGPIRLPPAFDAWFFGCVNRDPQRRFASAGAAASELAAVFGIAPLLSESAPSLAGGMAPQAAVRIGAASAPAAVAHTLESSSAVGAGTDRALAVAGTIVSARPQRSSKLPILALAGALLLVGGIAVGVFVAKSRHSQAESTAPSAATIAKELAAPMASVKAPSPPIASAAPVMSAPSTTASAQVPPAPPKPAPPPTSHVARAKTHIKTERINRPRKPITSTGSKTSTGNSAYGER